MNNASYQLETKRTHRHKLPTGALGVSVCDESGRGFAACIDGVYLMDLASGKADRLYQHKSYASGVVCFPDQQLIISGGYDGMLQWYSLESQKVIRQTQAHSFWSWDLVRASAAPVIATSTGQYLAGDYQYRPRRSDEPTVRVYDAISGELIGSHEHLPPVQSLALSSDGTTVAAGNLMGDVGVWQTGGELLNQWNTPDFTGFGIIKSHCQIGGIYATQFTPDDESVVVAGMGPMRDPMAGNGKQRWQRFQWADAQKLSEAKKNQVGEGLMETLCFHPSGKYFVMAGRLRGGQWNAGFFDLDTGDLIHSIKTDSRVTDATFVDPEHLVLSGAIGQSANPDKQFGVVDIFSITQRS